jgi:POT family proton-dependent oligopeptide transporter
MSKYLTAPVSTNSIPRGIPYIIGNEAAERFSFYGMKAILVVFMTTYLYLMPGSLANEAMPDVEAIANYHKFTAAVYFTPIFGALIADIFLGKYLTIIILSLVYCVGHGVLALMGIDESIDPATMLFVGLAFIAVGAGGIKPCVSAHVGDQFGKTNAHLLNKVYNFFYLSINFGAFISTLLTPWLLEWYGPHLAFGVPGVLMLIATFLFWCGRKKFIHVPPGGLKWFKETFSWQGISAILKLGIIYLFVAVFWALFDQTGSSWVIQAEDLDRNWLGVTWLSSQIQAINPIMILIYVPLFVFLIYPAINKVFTLTPIRKISIGLFVMVVGFAIAALVQASIDAGNRPSIGWQILAYAILTGAEVMVSITCLEFSYTQAPRTMKSVVMALFLMSVSLGNTFTASVNVFILVESNADDAKVLAASFGNENTVMDSVGTSPQAADDHERLHSERNHRATHKGYVYSEDGKGGFALNVAGVDAVLGSEDDIQMAFAADGTMEGFVGEEADAIKEGIERVGTYWEKSHRLPNNEEGTTLLEGLHDPWGEQIRYQLKTGKQFYVTSDGPDKVWESAYDIRADITVDSMTPEQQREDIRNSSESDLFTWAHPEDTWLERRLEELAKVGKKMEAEEAEAGNTSLYDENGDLLIDENPEFAHSIRWDIGGATLLAGASYFWFWTWIMLGAAILFVPVGWLYKPHTYLQEEGKSPAA